MNGVCKLKCAIFNSKLIPSDRPGPSVAVCPPMLFLPGFQGLFNLQSCSSKNATSAFFNAVQTPLDALILERTNEGEFDGVEKCLTLEVNFHIQ